MKKRKLDCQEKASQPDSISLNGKVLSAMEEEFECAAMMLKDRFAMDKETGLIDQAV